MLKHGNIKFISASEKISLFEMRKLLHPEELLIEKDEFLRSRYALRRILPNQDIPWALVSRSKEHPYPRWPQGYCGSITHKNGHVGACLKKKSMYSSIGIDLEISTVAEKVGRYVLSEEEQKIFVKNFCEQNFWALVFSIKESSLKCFYPLAAPINFREIKILQIDFINKKFESKVGKMKETAQGFFNELSFDGESYVFTCCWIKSINA
jgi:4'-phosphopantetheinyl transferase EntD